jgi:hypothetical protein
VGCVIRNLSLGSRDSESFFGVVRFGIFFRGGAIRNLSSGWCDSESFFEVARLNSSSSKARTKKAEYSVVSFLPFYYFSHG